MITWVCIECGCEVAGYGVCRCFDDDIECLCPECAEKHHDVRLVLESAEKPGVRGRVVTINMLYTTLEDLSEGNQGALLQIPNSLFFQKIIRRWRGPELPQPLEK